MSSCESPVEKTFFKRRLPAMPRSAWRILARNPDVIIDMGEMAQTVGITDRQKQAVAALWRRYPTLKAVRSNQVFAVASDIFVVPGPRVTEAAGELARMLHPEAAR
jgi:ABC-type Fe3+-hydroxamate transport system substrate-binding protein